MSIATLLAGKGSRVVTCRADQTIRDALRLLTEHNIGAVVVVDGGIRPIGIVSERDIVRHLARNEKIFAEPVGTIMTRDLVIGVPQDDLRAVGHTMTERRIRHLPVVEGGALVGIVSIGDVMKAQRDQYEGELDTLQFQILNESV
jgi:CBS domain-containing protein